MSDAFGGQSPATVVDGRSASFRLDGKVAVVVGGGGAIGRATVEALASAGATTVAADLTLEGLSSPHTSQALRVDIASEESVSEMLDAVIEQRQRVDIVVVASGTIRVASVFNTTGEAWDDVFAVNARGPFLVARAAAERMRSLRIGGRIICFASIVARTARLNNVAYSASKAALVQAVRCMALELAPYGITVNSISPGSTRTPMLLGRQMEADEAAEATVIDGDLKTWRLGIPLRRVAEPSDQAAAVVFLASDAARHVTGHELVVDGGQSVV